jgi:hypothetical protein
MEPGGIESPPIHGSRPQKCDSEHERATLRAVHSDPTLSQLVQSWAALPSASRELIAVILAQGLEAAVGSTATPESPTRLSCTDDERSNARQGVQCELGSGADESDAGSTDAAGSPEDRGPAATDDDSGEVLP